MDKKSKFEHESVNIMCRLPSKYDHSKPIASVVIEATSSETHEETSMKATHPNIRFGQQFSKGQQTVPGAVESCFRETF